MVKEPHSKFVPETGSQFREAMSQRLSQEALSTTSSIFSELTGLSVEATSSTTVQQNWTESKSSKSLPGTNIGYKMLRKAGWREGTGLGISEQGRLDPLDAPYKSDRSGIGATKKRKPEIRKTTPTESAPEEVRKVTRKEKRMSKKASKLEAEEQQRREQAFQRDFYREFWPENV